MQESCFCPKLILRPCKWSVIIDWHVLGCFWCVVHFCFPFFGRDCLFLFLVRFGGLVCPSPQQNELLSSHEKQCFSLFSTISPLDFYPVFPLCLSPFLSFNLACLLSPKGNKTKRILKVHFKSHFLIFSSLTFPNQPLLPSLAFS